MSTTVRRYVQAVVDQAGIEAQKEGAAAVEAQHLLLAIAAEPEANTQQVLSAAGLDYEGIRTALQREFEQSLGVAGVSLAAFDMTTRPGASHARPTKLGASAKLARERGLGKRRGGSPPLHLLLGILQAEKGTVPRALATAGINQSELTMRRSRHSPSTMADERPASLAPSYLAPADTRSAGPPGGHLA